MRAKSNLKKHTLNLRNGDWDYIESIAIPQGIATAEVIRLLVSNFVDRKRAEEGRPSIETDLDIQL